MKKWNFKKKSTLAALVAGFLIAGASIAVLANSARLSRAFDPDDYRHFDDWEDFEPDYDSIAGDGEKSDLADQDESGENRGEDSQQDIRTEENILEALEDGSDQIDDNTMGLASDEESDGESGEDSVNPNAYELTDQGGVGTLGTDSNEGTGSDSGSGSGDNQAGESSGGNGGGTSPRPTQAPELSGAPSQRPVTPTPKPSWEQQQLSPDEPVMTKDGELVALRVSVPDDWTFFRGDSFSDEGVTVEASIRNSGNTSYQPLPYGGSDGYSVSMSTESVGGGTAVFSYLGVTARRRFKVLSSRVSVRYLLNDNYAAEFPGPVGGSEAELAALRGLDPYAGQDGYADLRRHHSYMIAFLGDEDIRAEFAKDHNYASAMFLETDEDGYLVNMLTGFRYLLQRVFQDESPRIYYPITDWGDYTGRSVADAVAKVPDGYKLRREAKRRGSLLDYTGDQVLTGYEGEDEALKAPDGTTKIAFEDGAPNTRVVSMTIPESVGSVDAASVAKAFPGLQEYAVTGHSVYRVVDGALYTADGTTLISLPPGARAPDVWPRELTTIGEGAFYGNSTEKLVLPSEITSLEKGCFAGFLGDTIRLEGNQVPVVGGDLGYEGKLLVEDSEYDHLYREWMFALGSSANRMMVGAADESGNEIPAKQNLYHYDEKNRVLSGSDNAHCLAAVPADCGGRFLAPEGYTSVGYAAFAGCDGLYEIEFSGDMALGEGSLILPGSVRTVILQKDGTSVDPHLFGGRDCGDLTVYVPLGTYDRYLADWRETIDPVSGVGTVERILKPWDDSVFIEDNARYRRLMTDGAEQYELLGVYGGSQKSFRVKDGTAEIADGAFAGCSGLEIICLPETLTRVGQDVFAGCTSLQTIADGSGESLFAGAASEEVPEGVRVCCVGKPYRGFIYDDSGAVYGKLVGGGLELLDVPTDAEGVFALRKNTVILGDESFRDCVDISAIDLSGAADLREVGKSCFENCSSLAGALNLKDCIGLTAIERRTFYGCTALESVSLSKGVLKLGRGAFSGCKALTSVKGTGLQSIAENCFRDCSSLNEAPLAKVTAVGDRAFLGCSSLKNINDAAKLERVGVQAFMGCSALADVKLPKTLRTMDEECFRDCSALKSVSLRGKVTAISRYCFFGCQSLENVSFAKRQSAAIQVIGVQAFAQCSSLVTIDLRGLTSLKEIGSQAFANCEALSIAILPKSLSILHDYCFTGCGSLSILALLADSPPALGVSVFGEKIPGFLHLWVNDGRVNTYLNAYRKKLNKTYGAGTAKRILGVFDESQEIIGGVTYVHNEAGERILKKADKSFEGVCQVLADTAGIADRAFADCTKLTGVELPAGSSVRLGDRCFEGCTALETVHLYGSIPDWGDDTFRDCKKLSDLRFGQAGAKAEIARIGTRAFKGCTGLAGTSSVSIQTPILSFGKGCFADCTELGGISWSVSARETVRSFEDRVFANCTSMIASINSNFTGLESIGAYAFSNCDSLENPSIPAAVTVLGEGCFADCDKLATVSIYGAVEEYPAYCFRNCVKMTRTGGTAAAFSALKRIGESAYEGCVSLNSSTETTWYLSRYENLEEIGAHAFRNCTGLTRDVSFAASLVRIGAGAFDGCSGLAKITLASEEPPEIGLFAPDTMAEGFTLCVPDSMEEGDRIYLAYRERMRSLLGRELADAILDSVSDEARERNLTDTDSDRDNSEITAPDGQDEKSSDDNTENTEGEMP